MSIKEFIVKIVDKLVELTNDYRSEIENRKQENEDLIYKIDNRDSDIEHLKRNLMIRNLSYLYLLINIIN